MTEKIMHNSFPSFRPSEERGDDPPTGGNVGVRQLNAMQNGQKVEQLFPRQRTSFDRIALFPRQQASFDRNRAFSPSADQLRPKSGKTMPALRAAGHRKLLPKRGIV
jgi:hypothetical protein